MDLHCLFTARVVGEDRHYIFNSEYKVRRINGTSTVPKIESVGQLLELLFAVFGINVEDSFSDVELFKQSCEHFLK